MRLLVRVVAIFLLLLFLFLDAPRGIQWIRPAEAATAADACCGSKASCCCSPGKQCGMCSSSEQERASFQVAIDGCPGPAEEVLPPGQGPKFALPSQNRYRFAWNVTSRVNTSNIEAPQLFHEAPEPPPPRLA